MLVSSCFLCLHHSLVVFRSHTNTPHIRTAYRQAVKVSARTSHESAVVLQRTTLQLASPHTHKQTSTYSRKHVCSIRGRLLKHFVVRCMAIYVRVHMSLSVCADCGRKHRKRSIEREREREKIRKKPKKAKNKRCRSRGARRARFRFLHTAVVLLFCFICHSTQTHTHTHTVSAAVVLISCIFILCSENECINYIFMC